MLTLSSVKPVLLYRCRAHIKNELCRFGFEEDKPNLTSLVLYHDTEGRREDTKELFRPFPVPPHETVAEGLREQIHLWRQSEMWSRLLQALDTSAAKHEITKVIGLALGNLWLAGETARHSRQHALLLTLRQWLLQHKENFPCYVQDLVYNSTDASILEEHGVEIIEGPRAWLEIDDNTMVVSVAPNVPVREIIVDIARPAVVIWEQIEPKDDMEDEW